ncbi:beta-keratin-related protein-like [Tyto alba]|uniref:beta-keratin-related protein-like n=1 Tax=Tyto alba TaxID=56313 RepID=UPI001C681338|nr:beta-keratin-related protein-like [Tyto alba]
MNDFDVRWYEKEDNMWDVRNEGLITREGVGSGNSYVFRCFMSKGCWWPHRALGHSIKACAAPGSASSSLASLSSRNELCFLHGEMSCFRPCPPQPCCASGPTPLASSCSEPCVARCADSTVFIEPSPVVVTLPGPILNSFPQSTAVGSSLSAAVGSSLSASGVPISSGGSLGLGGSGMCLPVPRCSLNC